MSKGRWFPSWWYRLLCVLGWHTRTDNSGLGWSCRCCGMYTGDLS